MDSVTSGIEVSSKNVANSPATITHAGTHWAPAGTRIPKEQLETKFEIMKSRNWMSERMVAEFQRHWHCTREEALERMLFGDGE